MASKLRSLFRRSMNQNRNSGLLQRAAERRPPANLAHFLLFRNKTGYVQNPCTWLVFLGAALDTALLLRYGKYTLWGYMEDAMQQKRSAETHRARKPKLTDPPMACPCACGPDVPPAAQGCACGPEMPNVAKAAASGSAAAPAEGEAACPCAGASGKRKHRDPESTEYQEMIRRLNRIEGQVCGVRRMVEEDRYCVDILTQVSAISAALNAFNKILLAQHIKTCVVNDIRNGNDEVVDELCDTLQKLMK